LQPLILRNQYTTMGKKIEIVNRKAKFEYEFLQSFEAGVMLTGTEVKSLRAGNANLTDAYCLFVGGDLYIKSLFIAEYEYGNQNNHESRRDRRLLLRNSELAKIQKKVEQKGVTIVPYRIYTSERGFFKLEIALAQGKKSYDKRQTIKEREQKLELGRLNKITL
jgi:SsrA-binding protein